MRKSGGKRHAMFYHDYHYCTSSSIERWNSYSVGNDEEPLSLEVVHNTMLTLASRTEHQRQVLTSVAKECLTFCATNIYTARIAMLN